MTQVLTSFIAVAGTLLGGCLGYLLQRHAGNRAERRAAVLAYTAAITWRKHEQPDGPDHKAARLEGQRRRGVARQAVNGLLFSVGDVELVAESRRILEEANTVYRAADRAGMGARAAAVRDALDRCSILALDAAGGLKTTASRWRISGTVSGLGARLDAEALAAIWRSSPR